MTEIEKMFENAGISKIIPKICSNNELDCIGCIAYTKNAKPYCKNAEYPDFTAEKQLELIKWLAIKYKNIGIRHTDYIKGKWQIFEIATYECYSEDNGSTNFGEVLANLTNNLWQSLTDQEKEEIRGILNE